MQNPSPHPQIASAATSAADSAGHSSTAGSVATCKHAAKTAGRRQERYRRRQTLIHHLFFVESWPSRFIALQLNVSQGCVVGVINRTARLDAEVAP